MKSGDKKQIEAADQMLIVRVKLGLLADPALQALPIGVNASDGVVTLYGTVDTPENRDKAAQVASGLEGVKTVQNEIAVTKRS